VSVQGYRKGLTDLACKTAKPAEKDRKLWDSGGLHLFVTKRGSKTWRLKYRFDGKEKLLTIGSYPDTSLLSARDARDDAKRLLRTGVDPSAARRQQRHSEESEAANTFETVARQWHDGWKSLWKPKHADNVLRGLEKDIFPKLGAVPIRQVTSRSLLKALEAVQDRGAVDRARRLRQQISDVFAFAIGGELADSDPAAPLAKVLKPVRQGHYHAVTTIEDARALLLASEAAPGHPVTKLAARLMALTAVRSGPLRAAEKHEFTGLDTASPEWRIPAEKMKLREHQVRQGEVYDFIVPLAPAAVEIVRLATQFSSGSLLFPSSRNPRKPMSDSTLSMMYRRLPDFGGRHVPHGWRSTFSTIMNERAAMEGRADERWIIDKMLAHQTKGVEAIYNRGKYMARRRLIANAWAELLLDGLPPSSSLLDILRH
jgi:integrase